MTYEDKDLIELLKKSVDVTVAQIKDTNNKFDMYIEDFANSWISIANGNKAVAINSIDYLVKSMKAAMPEYTTLSEGRYELKLEVKKDIGAAMIKALVKDDMRDYLVEGLMKDTNEQNIAILNKSLESAKVTIPVVPEEKNPLTMKDITVDPISLSRTIIRKPVHEITKFVDNAGNLLIQELKEGNIELSKAFSIFAKVWHALPGRDSIEHGNDISWNNIALKTLKDFKNNLRVQLPQYCEPVPNSDQVDLANKFKQDLAQELINNNPCSADLRHVVIVAMTDFEPTISKKFVKPTVTDIMKSSVSTMKNN